MDYKSVDKAYRWRRSNDYLEDFLKRVDRKKHHYEQAQTERQVTLKGLQAFEDWDDLTPMEKLAIQELETLLVNLHKQELKINIFMYNGDLRNCIKSFEKFKELSCDLLGEVEERVEQDVCQESDYLQLCKDLKEQVEDVSTFLKGQMECYKGGCVCCV